MAANNMPLPGGNRCTKLQLSFVQVVDDCILPDTFVCPAEFYEAKIEVDAILSYPWLLEHQVGVYPHLHALSRLTPQRILLFGSTRGWESRVYAADTSGEGDCIDTTPYGPHTQSKRHRRKERRGVCVVQTECASSSGSGDESSDYFTISSISSESDSQSLGVSGALTLLRMSRACPRYRYTCLSLRVR